MAVAWAADVADAQRERGPVAASEIVARSIARPHAPLEFTLIEMHVCGSGEQGGRGYLNSKADYRDRGSLNVELAPGVRAELAERLGGDPVDVLLNKRIVVGGRARQVRIDWFLGGVPTGEFYFQTQLRLESAAYLEPAIEAGELSPADCADTIV
ncbi:MAG: hypothetical protein ACXIVL_02265 [Oceanicaulis sp.]